MTESEHLAKQFTDLYDGTPWIDVTITATLEEISAKEAATKVFPHFNSIWEIVNHMIQWRNTVMKRMHGEDIETPEGNYFSYIRDRSENTWQQTKNSFGETQDVWLKALKKLKKKDLDQMNLSGTYSNYDLISGILQHDAYHLGQIRLLKKMVQL